jgi:hypothetical protein
MAMSPGNQAITGGTVLRAPAIQSPNYVAGVSGWIIRQDGSAEFNAGTFRGSIEVGSLTGQHFWVNNPSTGDMIDVYNSLNKLVFSIDANGKVTSADAVGTAEIVLNGANLLFEDTAQSPVTNSAINGGARSADASALTLSAGQPANYTGVGQGAFVVLNTGDTPASEWINTEQRGIPGALLQTDQNSNANQLLHLDSFSGTTGASGAFSLANAASFPIKGAMVMFNQTSMSAGIWCSGAFNYGSTTLNTQWLRSSGTGTVSTYNNSAVAGTYIAWG